MSIIVMMALQVHEQYLEILMGARSQTESLALIQQKEGVKTLGLSA